LAVLGGVAVGNLYWAQPLLHLIADDLHVSTGTAASLVTTTQLFYAVGIVLIVPLGDSLNRRRLIPVMLVCSAVALLGCAVAPTFGVLLGAITLMGLTTVAGQIAIPMAGDLADDASRGRVIGTVMAGFLAGTLVSRTPSGLVVQAATSSSGSCCCTWRCSHSTSSSGPACSRWPRRHAAGSTPPWSRSTSSPAPSARPPSARCGRPGAGQRSPSPGSRSALPGWLCGPPAVAAPLQCPPPAR
jgi:MFS family permease